MSHNIILNEEFIDVYCYTITLSFPNSGSGFFYIFVEDGTFDL